VATLLTANAVLAPHTAPLLSHVGHDFLPFYAAGSLLREGNPGAMYDVALLRVRERQIADAADLPHGSFGPFWNPPFYAMPFAPLSVLPFRAALLTWLAMNLVALSIATVLMCKLVGGGWTKWGLTPLFLLASAPFLLALTHGQNTFCSLLLLTLAVGAWRGRRAVLTGALIGLLAYKPQLAALVGLVALIDLGWRVVLGGLLSTGALVIAAAVAMPGIFETYRTALPSLLHYMQVEHVYMWERHVTLKAFWRLLLQGFEAGEAGVAVTLLTTTCAAALGIALIVAAWRCRRSLTDLRGQRDRLIAATIATMPLVMPFYFDYDLLLLAIPAVLIAVEESDDLAALRRGVAQRSRRMLLLNWAALYCWLIINADVAEQTQLNLAVPLLATLSIQLIGRALQRGPETAQLFIERPAPAPALLAAAA
jgi:alpha-1,2-mannosyltransferase